MNAVAQNPHVATALRWDWIVVKEISTLSKKHYFDRHDFEVKPDSHFSLKKWSTKASKDGLSKDMAIDALAEDVSALEDAQSRLYASDKNSLLVILQGMDASGKDGAIRHVMSGVNPLGCRAYPFKAPNETELKHHFLWRPTAYLPERGMISIFNRSYYEEVLVVRVHPEFLKPQRLTQLKDFKPKSLEKLWKQRYREINAFERALVNNGTLVVKFYLHLSRDEQKQRLIDRVRQSENNWKFNPRDIQEREHWSEYTVAFEEAVGATSTEWAPWYVIPADDKWYARAAIADIIAAKLEKLDLQYPVVDTQQLALYEQLAAQLEAEPHKSDKKRDRSSKAAPNSRAEQLDCKSSTGPGKTRKEARNKADKSVRGDSNDTEGSDDRSDDRSKEDTVRPES